MEPDSTCQAHFAAQISARCTEPCTGFYTIQHNSLLNHSRAQPPDSASPCKCTPTEVCRTAACAQSLQEKASVAYPVGPECNFFFGCHITHRPNQVPLPGPVAELGLAECHGVPVGDAERLHSRCNVVQHLWVQSMHCLVQPVSTKDRDKTEALDEARMRSCVCACCVSTVSCDSHGAELEP